MEAKRRYDIEELKKVSGSAQLVMVGLMIANELHDLRRELALMVQKK